jgi:hypothetical protein
LTLSAWSWNLPSVGGGALAGGALAGGASADGTLAGGALAADVFDATAFARLGTMLRSGRLYYEIHY